MEIRLCIFYGGNEYSHRSRGSEDGALDYRDYRALDYRGLSGWKERERERLCERRQSRKSLQIRKCGSGRGRAGMDDTIIRDTIATRLRFCAGGVGKSNVIWINSRVYPADSDYVNASLHKKQYISFCRQICKSCESQLDRRDLFIDRTVRRTDRTRGFCISSFVFVERCPQIAVFDVTIFPFLSSSSSSSSSRNNLGRNKEMLFEHSCTRWTT